MADIAADRGGDLTAAETAMVRRASVMEVELMALEVRFNADSMDPDKEVSIAHLELYARIANSQRRILESIGTGRVAKDVSPTLRDFAVTIDAAKAGQQRQNSKDMPDA